MLYQNFINIIKKNMDKCNNKLEKYSKNHRYNINSKIKI